MSRRDLLVGLTVMLGSTAALYGLALAPSVVDGFKEWIAPKSFALVYANFKARERYRTLDECEAKAIEATRSRGSADSYAPAGCVDLSHDPHVLIFAPPFVPTAWKLVAANGGEKDGYRTLRECVDGGQAAIRYDVATKFKDAESIEALDQFFHDGFDCVPHGLAQPSQ